MKDKPIPISMLQDVPRQVYKFKVGEFTPPLMVFDLWEENTVEYLWRFIHERGSQIHIGFNYIKDIEPSIDTRLIKAVEFDSPIVHTEIFFGEHVARLFVCGNGLEMAQGPCEYKGKWEMVSLPFKNPRKAFEIGVRIQKESHKRNGKPLVVFNYHPLQTLEHFLCRLFIDTHAENDFDVQGDYDPTKPGKWTEGVHCSQLALLFLKYCVWENVLDIDPNYKQHFLSLYSFTCLPNGLNNIMKEIWPEAIREVIDYDAYWH
jgi:hypothetical protein